MKTYVFNVPTGIYVEAATEEEARRELETICDDFIDGANVRVAFGRPVLETVTEE